MLVNRYAFASLASLLIACSATPSSPDIKAKVAPVVAAEKPTPAAEALWDTSCAGCHGERGAFAGESERDADATLRAITAGTDAAPWHAFWFLGDGHRRALTQDLTGSQASDSITYDHRLSTALLKSAREDAVASIAADGGSGARTLARAYCAACHGDSGRGDGAAAPALEPAPRDWTTSAASDWRRSPSPSAVFDTLTHGIPGTAMASYTNLSIKERWLLAEHVMTLVPPEIRSADPYDELGTTTARLNDDLEPAPSTQLTTPRTWAGAERARLRGDVDAVDAKALYENLCASCHGASGEGVPGVYPPLVGVPWTDDPAFGDEHVRFILNGVKGELQVGDTLYNGVMPPFQHRLDDLQVAALTTWINTSWGNQGGRVSLAEVAKIRQDLFLPPYPTISYTPVALDDAKASVLTAPCAGCHGDSADAPPLSTYAGIPLERLTRALASSGSTHPRMGAVMHPALWAALVQRISGPGAPAATSIDALLEALSEP